MTETEAHRVNADALAWVRRHTEAAFMIIVSAASGADIARLAWERSPADALAWLLKVGEQPSGDGDGLSLLGSIHREDIGGRVSGVRRMLPRLHRVEPEQVRLLPGFDQAVARHEEREPMLPGILPDLAATGRCPSWLLSLYDQCSTDIDPRSPSAPWLQRLFVGALLSVAPGERGGERHVPTTSFELGRWMQPGGWSRRLADWEKMRLALLGLGDLRIPLPYGPGPNQVVDVPIVTGWAVPRTYDGGRAPVVLKVNIPGGGGAGAPIDFNRLMRYGAESAPLFRMYLSAVAVLDYSARHGRALTATIPAPVLGADGRPRRRKGGRIVRSATDVVPNPAAQFTVPLTNEDFRVMSGLRGDHPENRRRATGATERLADDGVLALERRRDGRVKFFSGPAHDDLVARVREGR